METSLKKKMRYWPYYYFLSPIWVLARRYVYKGLPRKGFVILDASWEL